MVRISEEEADLLQESPTFESLRQKVNAQSEQLKKIYDLIFATENLQNKEELKKVKMNPF